MIREFAEALVIVLSSRGDNRPRHRLAELLPESFSPSDLDADQ